MMRVQSSYDREKERVERLGLKNRTGRHSFKHVGVTRKLSCYLDLNSIKFKKRQFAASSIVSPVAGTASASTKEPSLERYLEKMRTNVLSRRPPSHEVDVAKSLRDDKTRI